MLCKNERLSKLELNRQIDVAMYERSKLHGPKLSLVVREIAPKAEQVFRDQYVLEFLGGEEYEHENGMKKALIGQMKRFVLELGKVLPVERASMQMKNPCVIHYGWCRDF